MRTYDKNVIKDLLTIEEVYELLTEWGGEPEYVSTGLISKTICHNNPFTNSASRKLYYYESNKLLYCYSGCAEPSFDIFELVIKVFRIQHNRVLDLNDAVRFIANRIGYSGSFIDGSDDNELEDWNILSNYERIQSIEPTEKKEIILKEYNNIILSRFNYNLKLTPWLNEGISQEAIEKAQIGFYPGGDQITIPHFDAVGRFIGLRGRTLCRDEGELFGKYRPIKINNILYNHPLGYNLYGLNWNKQAISAIKKVIIVEGEKSVLQYASYFGWDNNICVACCGSNISNYQIQLLLNCGVEEIIVALDRQFQEIGDDEFKKLKAKLIKLNNRFKNYVNISFIFDSKKLTGYKDSPLDKGKDKFLQLFKERIIL